MKNSLILILSILCFQSCKKEETIMNTPAPEVIVLKIIDNTGKDLINANPNPIIFEDLTLEYLVDGKNRIIAPLAGGIGNAKPQYGIYDYKNPSVFVGKTLELMSCPNPDPNTLVSTTYLTIKNKGTYKVEVKFLKNGNPTTDGKLWINGILVRTEAQRRDAPITLVVN